VSTRKSQCHRSIDPPPFLSRVIGGWQAKKEDSERQLSDLAHQMDELMQEKAELEVKNRILSKDLTTWQDHLEELWGEKVSDLFHLKGNTL